MKSQASVLLHILEALLLQDARRAYPELEGSFLKDYERLALYSQKRGLAFFTLDLPHLDSLLLHGLEWGRLSLNGPLSRRKSKRIQVPRLFSGLWLRVFDSCSNLKQEPDTTAIAFLRQLCCLGKKLQVECSPDRVSAIVRNYFDVEREAPEPTLQWDQDQLGISWRWHGGHLGDRCARPHSMLETPRTNQLSLGFAEASACLRVEPEREQDWHLLDQVQQVADLVARTLGQPRPLVSSRQKESEGHGLGFRHGPGAVAERLKNWEKSQFPNWPHKLEGRFPFSHCGKMPSDDRDRPRNHEPPSRMICVPKTAKGPRLIAAEPVAHQWCQQFLRSWLSGRIARTYLGKYVDFRRQDLSGALVLQASLDRKLATVDLSDASDRLTCWTVERMFRSNPSLLLALHAARTRWMRQDIDASCDSFIKLKKFASQGTAVTFPVQSIVFLIIALASAIGDGKVTMSKLKKWHNRVRVFGDDIIIPVHGYARLVRIMDLLGLRVNIAKSYIHGYFRESCGVDGYMGDDVTPVKPRTIVADGPESTRAVIDTINNLFVKGYWYASDSLRSHLSPRLRRGLRTVGRADSGFDGLTSYSGSDESHLVKRWNKRLHRFEGRVFRISERPQKRDRQGYHVLLDFCASKYSDVNPRVVSQYSGSRKVRIDFLWEPLNSGARGYPSCSSIRND